MFGCVTFLAFNNVVEKCGVFAAWIIKAESSGVIGVSFTGTDFILSIDSLQLIIESNITFRAE